MCGNDVSIWLQAGLENARVGVRDLHAFVRECVPCLLGSFLVADGHIIRLTYGFEHPKGVAEAGYVRIGMGSDKINQEAKGQGYLTVSDTALAQKPIAALRVSCKKQC